MGSFKKECGHLAKMTGREAMKLKEEILMKQKMKQADEDLSLIAAKQRSKKASEEIRKMLFS